MKKNILFILFLFLLSFSASAEVAINYSYETGDSEICHFGTFNINEDNKEVGIIINDKKYSLSDKEYKNAVLKAKESNSDTARFGITLNDKKNKLDEEYIITPYSINKENKINYFNKKEVIKGIYEKNTFPFIYDDFKDGISSEYTVPKNCKTEEIMTLSGIKNALKIVKDKPNIINIIREITPVNKITSEVRFMLKDTPSVLAPYPAFVMELLEDDRRIGRVYSTSYNDFAGTSDSEILYPSRTFTRIIPGVWYKMKLQVDLPNKKVSYYIQGENLKNLDIPYNNNILYSRDTGEIVGQDIIITGNFNNVNCLRFFITGDNNADFYIDYIKLSEDITPFTVTYKHRNVIDPLLVTKPEETIDINNKNIKVNNKLIYFSKPPFIKDNSEMSEYKRTLDALGFNSYYNIETKTIYMENKNNKNITLKITGEKLIYNQSEYIIPPLFYDKNDDLCYIPVTQIAEILGYSVNTDNPDIISIEGDI